eukprot:scaffold316_cov352-Pavlova_lutheri.AAC.3
MRSTILALRNYQDGAIKSTSSVAWASDNTTKARLALVSATFTSSTNLHAQEMKSKSGVSISKCYLIHHHALLDW